MKAIWLKIEDAPRLDHRPILLAVEVRPGDVIVGEAYWNTETETWWWANTSRHTGEYILESFIVGWTAMPPPPPVKRKVAA